MRVCTRKMSSPRPIRELDRIQRILEPSNRLDEFSSFRGNRTIMISDKSLSARLVSGEVSKR